VTYFLRLDGPSRDRVPLEAEDLAQARALAVRYLGNVLAAEPGFVDEGHWRLLVEDGSGRPFFHIIIAMVPAPPPPRPPPNTDQPVS